MAVTPLRGVRVQEEIGDIRPGEKEVDQEGLETAAPSQPGTNVQRKHWTRRRGME